MAKKPKSGGARMVESGKEPMLLGWTPEDKEKIRAAAAEEMRPMTQFVIFHALKAAEKILQNNQK